MHLLLMLTKDGRITRHAIKSLSDAQSLGDLMLMSKSIITYDIFRTSTKQRIYIKPNLTPQCLQPL